MTPRPVLPPAFRPVAVAPGPDPFEQAQVAAVRGAEDGTLLWSMREDALDAAVVLIPETSLEGALPVVYAALVGLGDCLGALLPPQVAVTFGWPDRLELNGAVAGGVRVAAPAPTAGEKPAWIVLGVTVAVGNAPGDVHEPGHEPRRTTVHDEGGGGLTAVDLLEAFGRHFLNWVDRWQEDGFRPLRDAYLSRATGFGTPLRLDLDGEGYEGAFMGLTATGGLLLAGHGATRIIALGRALRRPTWVRPPG
ncbi:MAG TPA: biotin/lipoate--protein ligase family protein [Geminicoccaceae bacterium]|nr:biotin/lipoate--protein ligase family protein [Geminicoccaceae bacterium]